MFPSIPENVFLDTSVVNFILDCGGQIHDGMSIPDETSVWIARDIEAFRGIWMTGQRASWRFTISLGTIAEIERTGQSERLRDLLNWASELWAYAEEFGARPAPAQPVSISTCPRCPSSPIPEIAS